MNDFFNYKNVILGERREGISEALSICKTLVTTTEVIIYKQ